MKSVPAPGEGLKRKNQVDIKVSEFCKRCLQQLLENLLQISQNHLVIRDMLHQCVTSEHIRPRQVYQA